jgi:CubicO group peptidase (beta-lactamase class C family)
MIFSPQKTSTGKKQGYGLGWFIHEVGAPGPERQFEHSGGVAGSSSWLVLYPDQGVVIAWLQNSNDFRDFPIRNVAAPFFSRQK